MKLKYKLVFDVIQPSTGKKNRILENFRTYDCNKSFNFEKISSIF